MRVADLFSTEKFLLPLGNTLGIVLLTHLNLVGRSWGLEYIQIFNSISKRFLKIRNKVRLSQPRCLLILCEIYLAREIVLHIILDF